MFNAKLKAQIIVSSVAIVFLASLFFLPGVREKIIFKADVNNPQSGEPCYIAPWTTALDYQPGAMVTHDSNAYIAILFNPPRDALKNKIYKEPNVAADWTQYWEIKPAQLVDGAACYLAHQTAPKFKPGNTLPQLTTAGDPYADTYNDINYMKEMAKRWGYAPYFGYANSYFLGIADTNPNSYWAQVIKFSAQENYPVHVLVEKDDWETLTTSSRQMPEEAKLHDQFDNIIWRVTPSAKDAGIPYLNPEAPAWYLRDRAKARTDGIKTLAQKTKIGVLTYGNENGLGAGNSAFQRVVSQDPRVKQAMGNRSFWAYINERKAYQDSFTFQALREIVPDRTIFASYYMFERDTNRSSSWYQWRHLYDYSSYVTDVPSDEFYYKSVGSNSGFAPQSGGDVLSQKLNGKYYGILKNRPLTYDWLSGNWLDKYLDNTINHDTADPRNATHAGYIGFIKAIYTTGTIGANQGYYADTTTGHPNTLTNIYLNNPPQFITQITALSHVHGLFSYLEKFLRNGDLLEGPNKSKYCANPASCAQPAYEFTAKDSSGNTLPDDRVLVRKMRGEDKWLVTAWAADEVDNKNIKVTIIDDKTSTNLGTLDLVARSAGSVYYVTKTNGSVNKLLIDADPLNPSANAEVLHQAGQLNF